MSTNPNAQPMDLKEMLAGAAAKERRNLGLSIAFTIIVLAVGFGWIVYSAKKVVHLKSQEAELTASIAKAKVEVAEQEGLLRKLSLDIANVKPTLDKCTEGSGNQDAKIAVAALSSAQESVQVALNNPIKVGTQQPAQEVTATPALTTVPNVTRMSFTNAEQKVRAVGLTATRVDQSGNAPPGTVLYQDPLPGQRLATSSPVTLYVVPTPSAPASTSIPDLKGLTFEEANRQLVRLGLTVRKVDQPGKGVPGTVLYQDPFTGRRVPAGSQVSLYVIPKPLVVQSAQ